MQSRATAAPRYLNAISFTALIFMYAYAKASAEHLYTFSADCTRGCAQIAGWILQVVCVMQQGAGRRLAYGKGKSC